ncbi:hypothetical protein N7450_007583 [Penicillium hetheringtonii]|uniref:Cytochrome P450 n=1 Tax=Penicillium hetheringtonii TaxID=911720 RepID=A0AAD6DHX6_9EURO|nr:hypothetical protein N7450_007583 [Penicillium hetheringtonii]
MIISLILLFAVIIATPLLFVFIPPWHPRSVPSAPFWITLLPLFFEIDQEEIFKRYLAGPLYTHGAIKIFFAGRWNVVFQRPELISEIFKKEHVYNKAGNQKKIPYTLLARFLGSNIISARGEEWRCYRAVIQPGLQKAFQSIPIIENAGKLCRILSRLQVESMGEGIPVQDVLQRYSSANLLSCIFDCPELAATGTRNKQSHMMSIEHEVPLHTIQLILKRYLFLPIYMSFPVLDRLSSIIPCRTKARSLVREFTDLLQVVILLNSDSNDEKRKSVNCLGARLESAWREGILNIKQLRDNLNVLYVAGQENPQLLMISSLYLLGKYTGIQDKLRREIRDVKVEELSTQDWRCLPYLTATIFECLRFLPPISQLINRRVAESTWLGGLIYLPKGTYVGYNSYATNRDPGSWGPDADEFQPGRWGMTDEEISMKYRSAKAHAEFISFHGGSRACLGERFTLLQMRVTLCALVRSFQWELDPEWEDRMTAAGPLHPRGLRLVFTGLQA